MQALHSGRPDGHGVPAITLAQVDDPVATAIASDLFREYAHAIGIGLEYQGFAAELAGLPQPCMPPAGALFFSLRLGPIDPRAETHMHKNMYGLYRASVIDRDDPAHEYRLRVTIPALDQALQPWASACVPTAAFPLPDIGGQVWVMFEAADATRPVWIGVVPRPQA